MTELGLKGAEALAKALGDSWSASSGRVLHAGNNENLGFKGALALLGLKVKRLDLSNVGLKDEWVKDLAASDKFRTNEVLEELRLAGNRIGEHACAELAKTLLNTDQLPQLKVLDVGEACPQLAEVMQARGGKPWQDTPVLSEELFAIRA